VPLVKLTSRNVLTLPAAGGGRTDYTDELMPGFVLRVSSTGARSYAVRYGARGDKRVTLGDARRLDLAEARKRAKDVLGRVARGEDPAGERAARVRTVRAKADTFEALATRLVAEADLATSTRRSWTWLLEKRVLPSIGQQAPGAITRGELRELLAEVKKRSAQQANDVLKVVRWCFARALDEDLVPHSPAEGLRKPEKERPRDRVLTHDELRGLWTAAGAAGGYGRAVRFALLTGARREEVFSARWSEVDRRAASWRLPAARVKNRRPHEYPLTDDALDAIGEARSGSEWLFPGEDISKALRPTSKAWLRLLRAAGLLPVDEPTTVDAGITEALQRPGRKPWTALPVRFHDLRRTVRETLTRDLGVSVPVAEAVIGHTPPKIVATYAPSGLGLPERRRALERWARELRRIVEGAPAEKVVALHRGRRGR